MAGSHPDEELSGKDGDGEPFYVAAAVRNGERRADRVNVVVRRLLSFSEAEQLAQALIDIQDLEGTKR